MNKIIKWQSLLCYVMIVSLLAACSGNAGEKSGGSGSDNRPANTGKGEEQAAEKTKLTFWNLDENVTESAGLSYVEEKFDVEIGFINASREAMKETLNLKIASGEIPDWWKEPSFTDYDKFLQQEVAAEIPQELIEEHMPKYMEWLKRFLGEDPFKYVRRDGKIYGLPVIWDIGMDGLGLAFREDWLKNVGIDKTPETIEEMEIALTKFRHDDPDGNGKKDTYGITAQGSNIEAIFSSVFGAYDAYPNIFREKDGQIVRGEIEPGAKQALEVLHRWYQNELIDPEFVVNKGENVEDKMMTDKIGAIEYYWWAFLPGSAFLGGEQWYDKLKSKHSDFNFAITGGVKGPDGSYGLSQYNPAFASGVMFGKQLADDRDKMIKYMQVFEASQFDPETYEMLNFGVKDTHWKLSDQGTVEFIAPYTDEDERKKAGLVGYSMAGSFNDYEFQTSYTSDKELRQLAQQTREAMTRNIDILAPFNKPVYNEVQDKLEQYTLQTFIDFITGRKSLAEFDDFIADWKKNGGDKVLEEAQQVYEEYLK
ncbi:extracellular solute-binding protein [Paenibacillus sp. J5C_2022]|uniref:extracellular solute-binding protein n=1 Tax=Paenibacillus sp. J5C2022 TaxID=2977129 RepID=UPI0021CE7580|nr:extracellular solute-binding protein [Paenibacillus sp. J5C2022]MCU6709139.1 extracellular solute-binding protein [Paenibacillus sp. J5C2022]